MRKKNKKTFKKTAKAAIFKYNKRRQNPNHMKIILSIALIILSLNFSKAQVVYFSPGPNTHDTAQCLMPVILDLDGNGVDDFQFSIFCYGVDMMHNWSTTYQVTPLSNDSNAVLADTSDYDRPLNSNDVIGAAAIVWQSKFRQPTQTLLQVGGNLTTSSFYAFGPWTTVSGAAFIGVRFDANGQTHYGWIQLRIDGNRKQIIIMNWA